MSFLGHSLHVSSFYPGNKNRDLLNNGLFHNNYVAKYTVIIYYYSGSTSLREELLAFCETLEPSPSPSLCFE